MAEDDNEKEVAQTERDQTTADRAKEAMRLACEAGRKFLAGNVEEAADMYARSGDMLASCVALQKKPTERDYVRILAAANYYKGGHFVKANRLLERVKPARLKNEFRDVREKFLVKLKERTSTDYRRKVLTRLRDLMADRKYEAILSLLDEHPYAFAPSDLTTLRFRYANLAGLIRPEDVAGQAEVEPAGGDDTTALPENEAAEDDKVRGSDTVRKTLFE